MQCQMNLNKHSAEYRESVDWKGVSVYCVIGKECLMFAVGRDFCSWTKYLKEREKEIGEYVDADCCVVVIMQPLKVNYFW